MLPRFVLSCSTSPFSTSSVCSSDALSCAALSAWNVSSCCCIAARCFRISSYSCRRGRVSEWGETGRSFGSFRRRSRGALCGRPRGRRARPSVSPVSHLALTPKRRESIPYRLKHRSPHPPRATRDGTERWTVARLKKISSVQSMQNASHELPPRLFPPLRLFPPRADARNTRHSITFV